METKKLNNSSDSILDKFDDLANKMNQGTKPTEDEKQATDDKPETAEHKESEKPEATKAEDTKETTKPAEKEADKEKPATKDDTKEDTKADTKDTKAEDKEEPAKKEPKEPNDEEDSKVEPEAEKSAEPDKKSDEVAKDAKDNSGSEWHTGQATKSIGAAEWDKLYEILNKSYENYQELSERINNTEALVKSINDNLVPTVQKAMDLIKDNDDLVDKDSTSPEDVAKKSAELEEKQQAAKDTITKSAKTGEEKFAKDSNSDVVDEIVNKDSDIKGVSTNNAEEAQKDTNFTQNDYRLAALNVVGNFNRNLARDLKAGIITKNEASYRNSMTNAVYHNTASISTLKKYIELAK